MSANDMQVDGSHYKRSSYQHWDFTHEWFEGRQWEYCVTKYLFRWREKGREKSLEKAKHYLLKMSELVFKEKLEPLPGIHKNDYKKFIHSVWVVQNTYGLSDLEGRIIINLRNWRYKEDLELLRRLIDTIIGHIEFYESPDKGEDPSSAYVNQE